MKKSKKMVLMLCALVLLVGAWFGVRQLNTQQSVTETEGAFDLTAKTAEDLAGLQWTGEKEYSFTLKDGVWSPGEGNWSVNQTTLQEAADSLLGLQANRKIGDVSSPGDYGLETPAFTVTALWQDGTSTAYLMGDATPFSDGYYLSLSDGTDTVYTVSSSLSSLFDYSDTELAALEEIPAVTDTVFLSLGTGLKAEKRSESSTVDPGQLWYETESGVPLDGEKVEALIADLESLTWNELVSVSATAEELTGWHLDDAQATVLTRTGADGSSATLLMGLLNEDSDYYARLPGSNMVYTVDGEKASGLMTAEAGNQGITALIPLPLEALSLAEFTTEKGTWTMTKPAQNNEAETGSEDAAAETAPEDPAWDEAAAALWEKVTALKAEGTPEQEAAGELLLSLRAVNTAGKEIRAEFREYDTESYLATVDGGAPVLTGAEEIDALIRLIRNQIPSG